MDPNVTRRKVGRPAQYDWAAIRAHYDAGHSLSECEAKFGFSRGAWQTAVNAGKIVTRPLGEPLSDLLQKGRDISRYRVKKRLLKAGMLERRCALCGIEVWMGGPLGFHLDHIDGDETNWLKANLRLLCPNCHSQTPTYCGRNRGRHARTLRVEGGQVLMEF